VDNKNTVRQSAFNITADMPVRTTGPGATDLSRSGLMYEFPFLEVFMEFAPELLLERFDCRWNPRLNPFRGAFAQRVMMHLVAEIPLTDAVIQLGMDNEHMEELIDLTE
jgi:hypothetical protein